MEGLQQWNATPTNPITTNQSKAAQEQAVLGWDLALEGCVLSKWRQQQECYWKAYKSQKLSKRWMTELLKNGLALHGTCGNTEMKLYMRNKTIEH